MHSCIIIDDEEHAIQGLKKYIESVPGLELVASYSDAMEALAELRKMTQVDLILLDIDMPKITGIELSREIRTKTDKLVFTTGHTKYGYEAFKVDANDYLLKPYTLGEFIICIDKLFPNSQKTEANFDQNAFLVKSKEENNKIVSIRYDSVIAVESKLNYITIYTTLRKVTTYMSLTEMFGILNQSKGFLQFHRSFIIAYDYIEYINGNTINMSNGVEITVRDHYKKGFSEFVAKYLIRSSRVGKASGK